MKFGAATLRFVTRHSTRPTMAHPMVSTITSYHEVFLLLRVDPGYEGTEYRDISARP